MTMSNVEACYVKANMMETVQKSTPSFLDSGASHHVSGERESMRDSSGTTITTSESSCHRCWGYCH